MSEDIGIKHSINRHNARQRIIKLKRGRRVSNVQSHLGIGGMGVAGWRRGGGELNKQLSIKQRLIKSYSTSSQCRQRRRLSQLAWVVVSFFLVHSLFMNHNFKKYIFLCMFRFTGCISGRLF